LEHRREKTAVGALRINVAWLQIRHLSTIISRAHCRVICDRVNKLFSVSLLLCFILTGCLTKSTSNSGGIGGTKVQNTNPSAIIAAARTVFAQSGYTISGVDYPSTISFDKPAGKLGELIYGSYGVTTTVRVKLSLVPIPGTNDYWLKPSVFRVSDAGEAGFEDSTKMLGLWSGEFKPLLRQIQAQAAGAGPDV
jgi:hypothetical protein